MRELFLVGADQSHRGDRQYLYLIIYDIIDNKNRNKVFKYLKSYGTPVQKSCFETYLSESQFSRLEKRLIKMIDWETDNLRIYQMNGLNKVYNYGVKNVNAYIDLLIL